MGKEESKKKKQNRYLYRAVCAFFLAFFATDLFTFVWIRFVNVNNQTGNLMGLGNLGMAVLIYIALFILVGKWMRAFRIGVDRLISTMTSQILTVLIVDFLELFISLAITGQFRFFFSFLWRYALLFVVQSVVLVIFVIPMVLIYREIYPPLQMIEVFGEKENNIEKKMNGIPYKYHIAKSFRYNDPELHLDTMVDEYSGVLINDVPSDVENTIIKMCFDKEKRVYIVPKIADIILKSTESINVMDTPIYLSRNHGMSFWQRFVKRTMDIVCCSLALLVLSPVFLIVAIAIKINDGGPVFYKQERVTKNGKHFMILKFRSMIVDAEKDGKPHPAGEKDNRITKVGRIIRACRIDELPQLINILAGDMSIVGPRPERYEHVEVFTKELPEFKYRLKVKGGLTGYAQVYGKYNTTALDKLKLDLIYITNYSILLDIQIIFETVKILLQKDRTEGFSEERAEELRHG